MKADGLRAIHDKAVPVIVWILRLAVGATFIFAGFSKAVDPWGFFYKIEDYLDVWHLTFIPDSVVVCGDMLISAVEFTLGVNLVLGCLRRAVCWCIFGFMVVMLPLTAYIALFSPVEDCGCFGDAWIISNNATFWKNVVITLATVYLIVYNRRAACVVNPLSQWMVGAVSVVYCLALSIIGYNIQPLYDFRPYKTGTSILADAEGDSSGFTMLYEKDGEQREFAIDALPDSTWTYVGRVSPGHIRSGKSLAIYAGDDDVTSDVIYTKGPQMLLVVNNPAEHSRARASMANSLNEYLRRYDGELIAVLATVPDSVEIWSEHSKPEYEVFTADDTALKELVRGRAALVYLKDGVIKWKRDLYSLPADFPDFDTTDNVLDKVMVIDDGSTLRSLTYIYVASLFIIYVISLVKIRKNKTKSHVKKGKSDIEVTKQTQI